MKYVMRLYFTVSIGILCFCPSWALGQNVFSVNVVDKSGAGSPFEVSGKSTLLESTRGDQLEWSWGEKILVKNISDKAILLFVATVKESGRYAAPVGRAVLGDGPKYQLEDDRFFNEKLIEPGESLILRDTRPGTPDLACCLDPLVETHDPSAEYHLQFVQFSDGSVFGDPREARDSLTIRQTIIRGLHDLLHSYEEGGESGFVAHLKNLRSYLIDPNLAPETAEQPPFFETVVCRQIISTYDTAGMSATLDKVRGVLKTAEKHAAMVSMLPKP